MARQRRNWTPEEDALLRRAVNSAAAQSRPLLWRELAKVVPGRSNKDCRRRWWNSLAEGIAKGPWSEEEDERLIEAVGKYGPAWSQVAGVVGSRNPDQCSSHWGQVLDPTINFCDWSSEEDQQLLHAVLSHGTNWASIACLHVPRRTTLALKNRYSTLRLRHENSKEAAAAKTPDAILTSFEAYSASSRPRTSKRRKVSDDGRALVVEKPSEEAGEAGPSNDNKEGRASVESEDGEEEDDDDSNGDSGDALGKSPSVQFMDISGAHRTEYRAETVTMSTPPWPNVGNLKRSSLHCSGTFNQGIATPPMVPETADQIGFENRYSLNQVSPQVGLWIKDPAALGSGLSCTYDPDGVVMSTTDYPGSLAPSPLSPPYPGLVQTPGPGPFVGVEGTESHVLRDMSMNATAGAVFHVSIEMACNKLQMDAVLAGLAGAGTPVAMKIDLKYS